MSRTNIASIVVTFMMTLLENTIKIFVYSEPRSGQANASGYHCSTDFMRYMLITLVRRTNDRAALEAQVLITMVR